MVTTTRAERVHELTVKIFRIILEESNGYEKEEIVKRKLAEDCASSDYFEKVSTLVKKYIK